MSLPPELRLEIYRYLLHSPEESILIHCSPYSSWRKGVRKPLIRLPYSSAEEPFQFQPAILCCSQQIKTEAAAVLYGDNHFRHSNNDASHPPHSKVLELSNVGLIRHLMVHLCDDGLDTELQDFADATFAIRRAVGSLRSFSLSFSFHSACDEHHISELLPQQVASNSKLMEEVTKLNVEEKIEVYTSDIGHPYDVASTYKIIKSFAHSIATQKKWHCVKDDGFYETNLWYHDHDEEDYMKCGWILRPSASPTQIPWADSSG